MIEASIKEFPTDLSQVNRYVNVYITTQSVIQLVWQLIILPLTSSVVQVYYSDIDRGNP
jgi:hypothetical protein